MEIINTEIVKEYNNVITNGLKSAIILLYRILLYIIQNLAVVKYLELYTDSH